VGGGAGLQGTSASAGNSANALTAAALADMEASMLKKMSRMKKKYEKKLAAAKEALEDLQEDFSYQRKQFMDAATEQEKDVRLYELICQSVLSEKDFKRVSNCLCNDFLAEKGHEQSLLSGCV
jgi:formiminotetrahydrofolate cyclodeaminase